MPDLQGQGRNPLYQAGNASVGRPTGYTGVAPSAPSDNTGLSYSDFGGDYKDAAQQHINDPNADAYLAEVARRRMLETGGASRLSDPTNYWLNQDPNFARNEYAKLQTAAGGALMTQAPQMDLSRVGQYANSANWAGDAAMGAGGQVIGAGNQLMALSQMPAGPSVAELAMRRQAADAQTAQASLAAGAMGANSALALRNAAQGSAAIQGNLVGQLGQQRAAEDMANRQFAAQAAAQAGGLYGQGAGIYGQVGDQRLSAANMYGGLAGQQAGLNQQQQQINNQASQYYTQLGYGLIGDQTNARMGYDANRTNTALQEYGIRKGAEAQERAATTQLIGAGVSAAGAVGGAMVGGPAGAAVGSQLGGVAGRGASGQTLMPGEAGSFGGRR